VYTDTEIFIGCHIFMQFHVEVESGLSAVKSHYRSQTSVKGFEK